MGKPLNPRLQIATLKTLLRTRDVLAAELVNDGALESRSAVDYDGRLTARAIFFADAI